MNTKTVALFLSLASLSGCVSANGPYSGDIQFNWTFTGLTCSQVPQVVSVAITIPGEVLQNNGVYPCQTNGYSGIVLHDFLPGNYSFTIQGLDSSGTVLYAASGTFHIDGSKSLLVDLQPTAAAPSYAYLTWTFPPLSGIPNPSCAQARIDVVDVTIDQGAPTRYACADGQTQTGVVSAPMSIGTHTITLAALSAEVSHTYPYYKLVSTLTTSATPVAAAYPLRWAVGGVAVQWDIGGGPCGPISTIYVNFLDPFGNLLYGPSGDPQTCGGGLFPNAIRYDYLPPGNYSLTLQGSYGGTVYTNTPYPQVIITAGVFADPQNPVFSRLHP
jgi:hypothetical protein